MGNQQTVEMTILFLNAVYFCPFSAEVSKICVSELKTVQQGGFKQPSKNPTEIYEFSNSVHLIQLTCEREVSFDC